MIFYAFFISIITADALAKLDSKSLSNLKIDDDNEDNQRIGTRDTFQSWASNWSDCTNATFNRVHKYWKSNSALHKEVKYFYFESIKFIWF